MTGARPGVPMRADAGERVRTAGMVVGSAWFWVLGGVRVGGRVLVEGGRRASLCRSAPRPSPFCSAARPQQAPAVHALSRAQDLTRPAGCPCGGGSPSPPLEGRWQCSHPRLLPVPPCLCLPGASARSPVGLSTREMVGRGRRPGTSWSVGAKATSGWAGVAVAVGPGLRLRLGRLGGLVGGRNRAGGGGGASRMLAWTGRLRQGRLCTEAGARLRPEIQAPRGATAAGAAHASTRPGPPHYP